MSASVRYSRRLAEKIAAAAQMACELHDEEVAALLLIALEMAMSRPAAEGSRDRRKNMEALVFLRESVASIQPPTPPHEAMALSPATASRGRA